MSNWKNVNNWHWVNKNCLKWAESYFQEQLVGLEAESGGNKAKITRLDECTGDVDLNQRKGKIITIYDVRLKLSWEGTKADGTEASGKITIPEVAHDTDIDDYVFEVTMNDETEAKRPVRDVVKKELVPQLRKKFANFSADLIKEHGADVYIDQGKSGQSAPVAEKIVKERTAIHSSAAPTSSTTSSSNAPASAAKTSSAKVNTTTLSEVVEFQTSAHELYQTLLDVQRVSIWTRGPAKISKETGSQFELFNGNVRGKLLETVPDKKIVQSWRLQSWPEDHYSTVTMTFEQKSDCVELHVKQTGVPVGEEELTQRNWTGYYWRSIKQAFGFGAVF